MYRAPTNPTAERTAGLRRPALQEWLRLRGEGDDAEGAAGATDDLEGRGDDHGAAGRQLVEIAKASEAELSAAVHDEVIGEGRVKLGGLARVGTHRFDAYSQNVALTGQKLRALFGPARSMRAVVLEIDILRGVGALRPSSAKEHPGAGRDLSVHGFPLANVGSGQEKIRIGRHFLRDIDDAGGADEFFRRDAIDGRVRKGR